MFSSDRFSKLMNFLMTAVIIVSLSTMAYASQPDPSKNVPDKTKININTADVLVLTTLPGVGTSLAERIIKHRTKVGKFMKTEDLIAVKGIGQKKYEKMMALIIAK